MGKKWRSACLTHGKSHTQMLVKVIAKRSHKMDTCSFVETSQIPSHC